MKNFRAFKSEREKKEKSLEMLPKWWGDEKTHYVQQQSIDAYLGHLKNQASVLSIWRPLDSVQKNKSNGR